MNKSNIDLTIGENETITATVFPINADDKSVSFSTSNEGIATVTPVQGKVTAIGKGAAAITGTTINGKTASCEVNVTE